MSPPFVFGYLLAAAARREPAQGPPPPTAQGRRVALATDQAPSSPWVDRIDAGVRPAKFAARAAPAPR